MSVSQTFRLLHITWCQRLGNEGEEGIVAQVEGGDAHVGAQVSLLDQDDATEIARAASQPLARKRLPPPCAVHDGS